MTTRIGHQVGITRYLQLYTVLSQALADGTIAPGGPLPSEPSLVRQYHVSRTTVRRALARLEEEGRIIRRRGSGTFAQTNTPRRRRQIKSIRSLDDLRLSGRAVESRFIDAQLLPTPQRVLDTHPDFGADALAVRSVLSLEGEPVALTTSYVPLHHAGISVKNHRVDSKAAQAALRRVSSQRARAEQWISAIPVDPFSARHLHLAPGMPLLNVRRLRWDERGRLLEFEDQRCRPDMVEFHMPPDRTVALAPRPRRAPVRP